MLVLVAIFALLGAALGLRFKVLILVPTSGLAAASAFFVDFGSSSPLPRAQATAMIAAVVALQIGYLAGIALRRSLPKRPLVIESAPFRPFLADDVKDRLDAR
jgi:hypothetical protein